MMVTVKSQLLYYYFCFGIVKFRFDSIRNYLGDTVSFQIADCTVWKTPALVNRFYFRRIIIKFFEQGNIPEFYIYCFRLTHNIVHTFFKLCRRFVDFNPETVQIPERFCQNKNAAAVANSYFSEKRFPEFSLFFAVGRRL